MEDLHRKLDEAAPCDLIITSAGVSKGDYDIVKDVLNERGDINFWSVRMRPAKPLAFGHLTDKSGRTVPFLGLPGNPVSAMVAFEMFARPAIRTMLGRHPRNRPVVDGVLTDPIYNTDGRRVYARVEVTRRDGTYYANPRRSAGVQHPHLHVSGQRSGHLPRRFTRQERRRTGQNHNAGLE